MSDKQEEMEEQLEIELSSYVKKVLRSEMGRNLVKIPDLSKRLGVSHTALSNKISRGTFSASFFFRVLQELGTKEISVPTKEKPKD